MDEPPRLSGPSQPSPSGGDDLARQIRAFFRALWRGFKRNLRAILPWAVGAAITLAVLFLAARITPVAVFFWNYGDLQTFFRDRLGWPPSLAQAAASVLSLVYAAGLAAILQDLGFGKKSARRIAARGSWILLLLVSKPVLTYMFMANFNGVTAIAQRCYFTTSDGLIHLIERDGGDCRNDPVTGLSTQPVTPDIIEIYDRQKAGQGPKPVTGDPATIEFFDPLTGHARVWYAQNADGSFDLFDASGFDPNNGNQLIAVTPDVVDAIKAWAIAHPPAPPPAPANAATNTATNTDAADAAPAATPTPTPAGAPAEAAAPIGSEQQTPTRAAAPTYITNPDWSRLPSPSDLANYYPQQAAATGINGEVMLHCSITATGYLADCQALNADPAGMGFGRAALNMAHLFQITPGAVNGVPVTGGQINIPIQFQAPGS